jgi:tight adherence protein B
MVRNTNRGSATLPNIFFVSGFSNRYSLSLSLPSELLREFLSSPLTIGLFAAGLALLGWLRIADETVFRYYQRRRLMPVTALVRKPKTSIQIFQIISIFIISLMVSILLTTSLEISAAISLLFTGVPFILARRRALSIKTERDKAWPVAIDEIVASLQAGKSITESLTGLVHQGPTQLQPTFQRINEGLRLGKSLERLLGEEMQILDSSIADQTLTTLLFAKQYGGSEVTATLRMLSTFLREESKVREEIDTRFGWVRNSAVLGAVAPWLLLALLSTQRSTIEAYQSYAGVLILVLGLVLTVVAFFWMERVAKIPNPPRPLRPILSNRLESDELVDIGVR